MIGVQYTTMKTKIFANSDAAVGRVRLLLCRSFPS